MFINFLRSQTTIHVWIKVLSNSHTLKLYSIFRNFYNLWSSPNHQEKWSPSLSKSLSKPKKKKESFFPWLQFTLLTFPNWAEFSPFGLARSESGHHLLARASIPGNCVLWQQQKKSFDLQKGNTAPFDKVTQQQQPPESIIIIIVLPNIYEYHFAWSLRYCLKLKVFLGKGMATLLARSFPLEFFLTFCQCCQFSDALFLSFKW